MTVFFYAIIILLALCIFFSLMRSIFTKRITGRIVAVNMIGTQVITIIALLSVMKDDAGLVDICLIYALIAFLAVVVLVKVYTGIYSENLKRESDKPAVSDAKKDAKTHDGGGAK